MTTCWARNLKNCTFHETNPKSWTRTTDPFCNLEWRPHPLEKAPAVHLQNTSLLWDSLQKYTAWSHSVFNQWFERPVNTILTHISFSYNRKKNSCRAGLLRWTWQDFEQTQKRSKINCKRISCIYSASINIKRVLTSCPGGKKCFTANSGHGWLVRGRAFPTLEPVDLGDILAPTRWTSDKHFQHTPNIALAFLFWSIKLHNWLDCLCSRLRCLANLSSRSVLLARLFTSPVFVSW